VLAHLVEATVGPIVVDLGAVTSIDDDGFGVLVAADHRLESRADRLRVARPRPEMLRAMHGAGVHRVLEIYETVAEAGARG
jgi:anti-anti-sigma factor